MLNDDLMITRSGLSPEKGKLHCKKDSHQMNQSLVIHKVMEHQDVNMRLFSDKPCMHK